MKSKYIENVFEELKDKVEYDSDVNALYIVINKMLDIDSDRAIRWWEYLLNNYDLKKLANDIDFKEILYDLPEEILKRGLIKEYFNVRNHLEVDKINILDNKIFNIYKDAELEKILEYLIEEDKFWKEKELIRELLKEVNTISKQIFDLEGFIKLVITLHLKYEKIDLDWLLNLTELPNSNKDKAKLKALLIDYI